MEQAVTPEVPRPLFIRFLRALIVGILTVFLFYVKVMGTILKLGIRAIRGIPLESKQQVTKSE